jgi:Ca2+-binding RTX toxin-like protein
LTVAAAIAALAIVPSVARADTSLLTYVGNATSGSLTVVGDASSNNYLLTFAKAGNTVTSITVSDSVDQITSPGGICSATGNTVTCTADGTHALTSAAVVGGDGNDTLDLHASNAPATFPVTFSGNANDDRLDAGPENDTFNGGDGHDQADYDGVTGPVNVSADGVANDGAAGETDNIGTDVEEIDGTNGADTLTATSSVGSCTADCTGLFGNGGNDTLNGGGGADLLEGQGGNDTINGGAGDDEIYGDSDFNFGELPTDGNDTIDAGAGNDRVAGRGGNDNVAGGDGSDAIDPGSGDDTVSGGAGDDFFYPGPGADDIHGGDGFDVMTFQGEPAAVNDSLDDVANDGANNRDGSGVNGAGAAADTSIPTSRTSKAPISTTR